MSTKREDAPAIGDASSGGLTAALLAIASVPAHVLAPIEMRLARLTVEFLPHMMNEIRCQGAKAIEDVRPLSTAVVAEAVALAFAAAVEIEKPLRELRDKIGARG